MSVLARTVLLAFVIVTGTAAELAAAPDTWDPRLNDICGLQLIDVSPQVSNGQGYWRLKEAQFEAVSESSGTHNIYVRTEDVNGTPIQNQKFFVTRSYNLFDIDENVCNDSDGIGTDWDCNYTKGGGIDNYYGDIAIWGGCPPGPCNGPYNALVSETSSPAGYTGLSDKVIGMMMVDPTLVTTYCADHVNFRLIYRWTIKSGPTQPMITLNPTSLTPSTDEGSSPPNDTFTVQNSGTGTLNYTINTSDGWLSVNPTGGSSTGEQDTITVSYATTSLAAGTHNATITVSDPAATNDPQTIAVTLTVNSTGSSPTINRSPATLSPSVSEGGNASSDSFTVANSGSGTLSYSITDNAGWLSINPSSGTSNGEADTITVSYSTASLSAGTYNATITVSDAAATNSPQMIAVTLSVTSEPFVLLNSDFEGGSFGDPPDGDHWTANDWHAFTLSGFSKHNVTEPAGGAHSPTHVQEFYESNWISGIYQEVPNASIGNEYRGSVYVRSDGSDVRFWIGIDPGGGTNAASGNIVWSDQEIPLGTWTEVTVEAVATFTTITLFVKAQNPYLVNHYVYIDDAALLDLGSTLIIWGDDNLDLAVDQQDFGVFQACLTGPSNPIPPGSTTSGGHLCAMFDADDDNDIDLADFGRFQRCFSGPGNQSNCETAAPYPPSP